MADATNNSNTHDHATPSTQPRPPKPPPTISSTHLYHSTTASSLQNSPVLPPKSLNAKNTGVCAPSSTVFVPFPFVISVFTYPGQHALINFFPPASLSSLANAFVPAIHPALLTAYAALGNPASFSRPCSTAVAKSRIMAVTSSSVLASRKRLRTSSEYLLSAPEVEATLTMRPVCFKRGRKEREARRVL